MVQSIKSVLSSYLSDKKNFENFKKRSLLSSPEEMENMRDSDAERLIVSYLDSLMYDKRRNGPVEARLRFCTHNPKMTDPVIPLEVYYPVFDGTLTGSVPCLSSSGRKLSLDCVGVAAVAPLRKFLVDFIYEGKAVAEHVYEKTDFGKKILSAVSYPKELEDMVCEGFEGRRTLSPAGTHEKEKQVYFPLGDGEYALLVLVEPVSAMRVFSERVRKKSISDRIAFNKGERDAVRYVPTLALRHVGGTNPQNVSHMATETGGNFYQIFAEFPKPGKYRRYPRRSVFELADGKTAKALAEEIIGLKAGGYENFNIKKGILRRYERLLDLAEEAMASFAATDWEEREKKGKIPKRQESAAALLVGKEAVFDEEDAMELAKDFAEWLVRLTKEGLDEEEIEKARGLAYKRWKRMVRWSS